MMGICDCVNLKHLRKCETKATKKCQACGNELCGGCAKNHHPLHGDIVKLAS